MIAARLIRIFVAMALVALTAGSARATFVDFDLGGTTSFNGWEEMNSFKFPVSGGFPGAAPWSAPAYANVPGSGGAFLMKLAGNAFFSAETLYFGSWTQGFNLYAGTIGLTDPAPVSGLRTVVVQIEIGDALGYDFYLPSGFPVLKRNGSAEGIPALNGVVLNRYQNGTFESPETGEEPIYVSAWAFEWHLSDEEPVTSFEVEFSATAHAQIYAMQLQESSADTPTLLVPKFTWSSTVQSPVFDGEKTMATYSFHSTPDRLVKVSYRENLSSGSWVSTGLHTVDQNGNVSVTITSAGDHRATWSRSMFFQANYTSSPHNP